MGCHSAMPFGSMTLSHVVNASKAISSSKNLLVNSDAPEWLEEQSKQIVTDMNIYRNTPPPNHRCSTAGGAQYMAAIELSRQCPALIGHTGSAVTNFFYDILCIRHAGHTGKCPKLYDFAAA
jgi:hypothetical protein